MTGVRALPAHVFRQAKAAKGPTRLRTLLTCEKTRVKWVFCPTRSGCPPATICVEPMTTVLLIDYPPTVRHALRARLSLEADLEIIGEADDASQGIYLTRLLDPDVVLIDAETPDLDAAWTVRSLGQHAVGHGIVVLSQHGTAMADGVAGTPALVVGKHEGQARLVRAIRAADRRTNGEQSANCKLG